MPPLNGLSDIAHNYDAFIIDLWGVVHDGMRPYPGAMECLRQLRGRTVLLLSNAPRRAFAARKMLRRMGIEDHLYSDILTSGEAVWLALRDRTDPWFASLGKRALLLGPERDRNVLEGLDLDHAANPDTADFVVNTGPDDERDPTTLAPFVPTLEQCLAAHLPMICANPDLEVLRGGERILCAGALAAYYAARGGDVRSIGKPHQAIYRLSMQILGVQRSRVLAIGDSLRTDIAGAAAAGLDSAWVLGGIHAEEIGSDTGRARRLLSAAGLAPIGCMPTLTW